MSKPSKNHFLIEAERLIGFKNIRKMRKFVEKDPENGEILNHQDDIKIITQEYYYKNKKSVFPVYGYCTSSNSVN